MHTKHPAYQPQLVHRHGHQSQAPLGRPALQGLDYLGIYEYCECSHLHHRDAQAAAAAFWFWTSRLRRCTGARPLVSWFPRLASPGGAVVVGTCHRLSWGTWVHTFIHPGTESISGQPLPST